MEVGVVESHEVVGKGYVNTENRPIHSTYWCSFQLHILHKATKSMAKLSSKPCGDLHQAVCFSRGDGAIYRPPDLSTRECLMSLRSKSLQKQPGQLSAQIPA